MAFVRVGLSLGGFSIEPAVEILVPAVFVAKAPPRGYWRPVFFSDYFSSSRLEVTLFLSFFINDIAEKARVARLEQEEARRLEAGMQVVLFRDPAPIDEWIRTRLSRFACQRLAPYCGAVPATLRPGLRPAVFTKTCTRAVRAVFSSSSESGDSFSEGDEWSDDDSSCLTPPGQASLGYAALFFFPELDVSYMWGYEYTLAKELFLSEQYGVEFARDEY